MPQTMTTVNKSKRGKSIEDCPDIAEKNIKGHQMSWPYITDEERDKAESFVNSEIILRHSRVEGAYHQTRRSVSSAYPIHPWLPLLLKSNPPVLLEKIVKDIR